MPRKPSPPPPEAPTLAQLWDRLPGLWPAAKGSLSLVRKPCVRAGCRACASGRKHPVWLYSIQIDGRRRCVYVPVARVAALQQALANGREVERLLCQSGEALVRQTPAELP